MKHHGSYFEFEVERNKDLMRAFHQDLRETKVIRLNEVWRRVANMQSARFWVSEERAAVVVARMMKGDKLDNMRPLKREMFTEIFNRVRNMMMEKPELSVYKCCIAVVNSPAPKFYMTPLSIRETIYKIKRKWYHKRKNIAVFMRNVEDDGYGRK